MTNKLFVASTNDVIKLMFAVGTVLLMEMDLVCSTKDPMRVMKALGSALVQYQNVSQISSTLTRFIARPRVPNPNIHMYSFKLTWIIPEGRRE